MPCQAWQALVGYAWPGILCCSSGQSGYTKVHLFNGTWPYILYIYVYIYTYRTLYKAHYISISTCEMATCCVFYLLRRMSFVIHQGMCVDIVYQRASIDRKFIRMPTVLPARLPTQSRPLVGRLLPCLFLTGTHMAKCRVGGSHVF